MTLVPLGGIDVGSNAIRMSVGVVDDQTRRLELLQTLREPVRLGRDVFTSGMISEETTGRAIDALERFKEVFTTHQVQHVRAVATSATREAHNREMFCDRVLIATGIELEIIDGGEEARLIHLAVTRTLQLGKRVAALIDIGGGSVELTLSSDGQMLDSISMNMGTVRLLQKLQNERFGTEHFTRLVQEYADATRVWVEGSVGRRKIEVCAGTGGNVEAIGELRKKLLGKKDSVNMVTRSELQSLIKKLKDMPVAERIAKVGLRPDRADVIVPAAIVLHTLMRLLDVQQLQIPSVGLKDGILYGLVEDLFEDKETRLHRQQVLASATQIGRRYQYDEAHGKNVARFALRLFDDTRALHNLNGQYRLILEVAALLHDIGKFVHISGHHKHSYYILANTPIIGLSAVQKSMVANLARYHRKSPPNMQHDHYKLLGPKDRVAVSRLAGILRLADALDAEHGGKVQDIEVTVDRPKVKIRIRGEGDLLLERWAIYRKAALFEDVMGVKMELEE